MEKAEVKCPYCGKIMSEGIIDGARYSLWWRDTDSKRGFLKSLLNLDKKNVRLSYPFYDKYCIAYLCRGCEKVVIDIAENNRNIRRDYGSDIQIEWHFVFQIWYSVHRFMKGGLWEVIVRNARIAAEQWKKGVYLPEDIHLSGRVIMKTEAV